MSRPEEPILPAMPIVASLALTGIVPVYRSAGRSVAILRTLPVEQPVRLGGGEFEESEQDLAGDDHAALVIGPGAGGDPEEAREFRSAVFAEPLSADEAQASGDAGPNGEGVDCSLSL